MSMSKRAAQQRAAEGGISIGELRRMISEERQRADGSQPSTVNPVLTKAHALDILERAIAARRDDEVPAVWRSDPYHPGCQKVAGDQLTIRNILREAG